MINLDLPRDEEGRFVLNGSTLANFDASGLALREGLFFPRFKEWIKDESGKCVLVKFRDEEFVPLYKSDIFAELIFDAFAGAAKLNHANVDVGTFNNTDVMLSEHVLPEGGEVITYKNINLFFGELAIGEDYSLDRALEIINEFAQRNNLKTDKNLRDDLLKLMLVDYLTFQQDRHDENILFIIQKGELRLAPAIDNEKSFLIDRIAVFLESLDQDVYKRSLEPDGGQDERVRDCFESVKNSTKIFNTPMFVPAFHTIADVPLDTFDEESCDEIYEYNSNNILLNLYAEDFAREMMSNKKLKEFFEKMNFSVVELVKARERKCGYKIPEIYVEFAENILRKQKRRIDRALKKVQEEEEEK